MPAIHQPPLLPGAGARVEPGQPAAALQAQPKTLLESLADRFEDLAGHYVPAAKPPMPFPVFKNRLLLEIEAKKTADSIFGMLTPAIYASGCYEDIVAGFFASLSDKEQQEKRTKMRETELAESQERRLLAEKAKQRQGADERQEGMALPEINEQLKYIQKYKKEHGPEVQQATQQIQQEAQQVSSMLNALHEARMNTIRQLRDGSF